MAMSGIRWLVFQFNRWFLKLSHEKELLHGMARDILHAWHQSFWTLPTTRRTLFWILAAHGQLDQEQQSKSSKSMFFFTALRQSFCRCNKSFVFANSETETCWEYCCIHFPTTPPCSTGVDVLETGNLPTLLSLPQMKNLGMTIELDPKGDKITCPAFGLYSSPAEYSTMGHIVLDLTSLAYQPKSRWRSAHPKRHVTFALSEQKSAYPAHTRELDEDDADRPLVCPERVTVSEDEDDERLVRPSSRKERVKEKREFAAKRSVPTQLRRRRGPPV